MRVAEARIAAGLVGDDLFAIVGHSAELNVIHALVHRGSQVDGLRLTESILSAYED